MRNALIYFYNMKPNTIHQIDKKIKFDYLNKKYILYPINKNNQEITDLYKLNTYMTRIGIYCHRIILNTNREIISRINNEMYVLLEVSIENRTININDIIYISNNIINPNEFMNIKRINWNKLWSEKIDYIEYQLNQFGNKYELIKESNGYFIGIAENCISLLNDFKNIEFNSSICHNRVNKKTMTDEFYNPFEFIIDKKTRDFSEYLKTFDEEYIIKILEIIINNGIFDKEDIKLFFVRFLFPSEYFDIYESIINNKIKQIELKKIIKNIDAYEKKLKNIYHYISDISNLPEIDWMQ